MTEIALKVNGLQDQAGRKRYGDPVPGSVPSQTESERAKRTREYLETITFQDDDFEFDETAGDEIDRNFASQSFWKDAKVRFFKNKGAVAGLVIILFLVFMAIAGPSMSSYTYDEQNIINQNMAPKVPGLEKLGILDGTEDLRTSTGTKKINLYEGKEGTYYYFGSDSLGRDIWTRTWTGTRISLYVALVAVIIDMFIGLSYGLISGYFGGKVDMIMQRIMEILNSIPNLVIVTLMLLIFKPGLTSITMALMFSGWMGMARIARAEMLKIKEQEFVMASRTLGAGGFRIIFSTVLPNIVGPVITQSMLSVPHAIFTEAFLAFIGLGVPEPMASLGSMISSGYNNFTAHPYMIVAPLIIMVLLMLSFTLFSDGLRDALDPKMRAD